jgi:hypothetical protein
MRSAVHLTVCRTKTWKRIRRRARCLNGSPNENSPIKRALHKAMELPKQEFKREVEKHLTGQETELWEIIYCFNYHVLGMSSEN